MFEKGGDEACTWRHCKLVSPRNRTIQLTRSDRKIYIPEPIPSHPQANHLYQGDAIEGLKRLRKGSVSLIISDPPYEMGKGARLTRYLKWTEEWISLSARSLRPGGTLYVCSPWETSGAFHEILSRHVTVRNRITWKREKGRGARQNWKSNMEDVWYATKGEGYTFHLVKWKKPVIAPYRENGKPKDWIEKNGERFRMTHPSNIWTDLCVPFWSMSENTPHPWQKPEKLVSRLIEASSSPKGLVVDPFLGSGTTAVVAKKLGRRFIGFEQDAEYVRLAMKRLALHTTD